MVQAESISAAADQLHVTQPTLSRQLMELEQSLGTPLFRRAGRGRKAELTEAGMFLRRRAEEILLLADRTQAAFDHADQSVAGDVCLGAGETQAVRILARAAGSLQKRYPEIHYHISSGDSADVEEQLDRGLIDFGLLLGSVDREKYDVLTLPVQEKWALLARRDMPLAAAERVRPADLADQPLIWPRQKTSGGPLLQWMGRSEAELNLVASYSLVYNASLLTDEGFGYTLCLDGLVGAGERGSLCVVPLDPPLEMTAQVVWKRGQVFSRAAALFLRELRAQLDGESAAEDGIFALPFDNDRREPIY